MPLSIAISPEGNLVPDHTASETSAFSAKDEAEAMSVLAMGNSQFLFHLAARKSSHELPPAANFWREFVGRFLTSFCHHGGKLTVEPTGEWPALIEQSPPMKGSEYLTPAVLHKLWTSLEAEAQLEVSKFEDASHWLTNSMPHWNLVGRVMFHLAENKKDIEHPFAFLATYTSGLNAEGKPRHLPLGQAIKEYAGEKNKPALLNLLEPVSRLAESSSWARKFIDSGAVYRPHAWTPSHALQFLKEVPTCDEAGIAVRIPDWWKSQKPPRPQVTVKVGGKDPAGLSAQSLLGFTIELTLDGEKLTPEELKAIKTAQGLVLVKGRWVEVDSAKLEAVLNHWQDAQRMQFSQGLGFLQAMRLISGAPIGGRDGVLLPEELRDWTGVEAEPWLENVLKDLRDPAGISSRKAPPGLKANLREYQSIGVNWLHFMAKLGLGACLADDMGLGKTLQILTLLLSLRGSMKSPALLVAPASLITNWKAEAEKFTPSLRLFIAHPSNEDAEGFAAFESGNIPDDIDLLITTYGMVGRLKTIQESSWEMVILDEAQAIKNPAAGQTRAIKQLQGRTRIALTGTPVENRLSDLWSIFDFLNPGLLGTGPAFSAFVKSLEREEAAHFGPLKRLVRPYILRRLKTDKSIISDLPDKTELTAYCFLTKPQAVLYEQTVAKLAADLKESEGAPRRGLILAALTTFKQICNHPAQHSGDSHYDPAESGKFKRLAELCRPIVERQERLLLFTQFTEIIPALRSYLRELFGRDGLVLSGKTPVKERRVLVEEFQRDAGPPFFILSLKAGGTGLTLTAASHVVHFDRWWNPSVENQATDRAFRIGQKRNVLVHKFVCRGTLEEKIDRLLNEKRALADGILATDKEVPITELSDAEVINLVSLDLNQVGTE